MPRKFKTPDSVAQNRENQRRSRARRRELIDDLSHQLNEYKRRGVEATLEVQNAARNVSAENRRLRALLNLHGISESEISRYLSSPDSSTGGISKTRAGNGMRTRRENSHSSLRTAQSKTLMPTMVDSTLSRSQNLPLSVTTRSMSMGASGGRASEITPEAILLIPTGSPSSGEGIANTVERHCRSNKEDYCQRCGDEDDQRFEQTEYFENETTSDIFPPVSDCFCPPGPSTISASHTEALETSCDTAAAILIELHSQADAARARIALGCKDISSCSVKNTTIFRLMEELGGEQFDL